MKIGSIVLNSFIVLIIIYLLIVLLITFYQRKLLYHPGENNYLDQNTLNHEVKKVYISSDEKLIGWYFEKNKNFKTLLFFHGNAGKIDNRIYKLNEFSKMNINYLIFGYRGFSGNSGKPHEEGLYKDSKAAKLWLNKKNILDEKIILYGESLGTAIAIDLAAKNKFAGIILESPFTSMTELAKKYYPYLPVNLILRDKFDSIKKLKLIEAPILIMHGKKDKIVPFDMGLEIYENSNDPKFNYFRDNDDHMMDFDEDLINSLKNFIKFINSN